MLASGLASLGLFPCGPDVGVVNLRVVVSGGRWMGYGGPADLGSELQARQSLAQMRLERTDHDEHERFRVASE